MGHDKGLVIILGAGDADMAPMIQRMTSARVLVTALNQTAVAMAQARESMLELKSTLEMLHVPYTLDLKANRGPDAKQARRDQIRRNGGKR